MLSVTVTGSPVRLRAPMLSTCTPGYIVNCSTLEPNSEYSPTGLSSSTSTV